jgi:uncharacterized phage protein gp47/JayE
MADLQTKSFETLVSEQAAAVQGASSSLVDFSVGSILRAIVEAYAAVALWLQWLVLQVLAVTRASTSTGVDLDSWMADYGFVRLSAVPATGSVTFSRFTPLAQAVIPLGALVQTLDGSQQYAVIEDDGNPAWSAALQGYIIAAGIASATVPVQAVTAGSGGNVVPGSIVTMGQAIGGVDTVTNANALVNGSDAESDATLRARFIEYLGTLSKATTDAVGDAILAIDTGLSYTLTENANYDGTANPGYFFAVVDDGSGSPSRDLLARVYASVDLVRPITSTFGIFPPVVVTVDASLTITLAPHSDPITTPATVKAALQSYINTLGLGAGISWSRLIQVAYDASDQVIDVSNVLLDGGTADVVVTNKQVIKAGTITVS